jgi:hypothetical protein
MALARFPLKGLAGVLVFVVRVLMWLLSKPELVA